MSYIVAGRLDDLPSDIRHHLGVFRHRVFVQRLHWEIPGVSHDATGEWDEFDGGATVHLAALSADEEVCGCARLMPTTGPYLLRDVFQELARPDSLPSSPSIWEMSRFAGSGLPDHRTGSMSGMSLFPYAMALALSLGATRVIGVVSRSVARLYRRFGLDLLDIGVGTAPGCTNIVACSIDLAPTTFHKLQCDPVTLLNSITRVGQHQFLGPGMPAHSPPTEANAPSVRPHGDVPLAVCDNSTVHTQATVWTTGP
ncbi:acyl-homoserine-lactone synthase [Paraburkholderia sp. DD10]|uniref:acyl-homoserine-lactone synthase n=1 Tax=Paraburkholderia sp. DD10 TaxID=3409691 RepID=UPI003BA0CAD6